MDFGEINIKNSRYWLILKLPCNNLEDAWLPDVHFLASASVLRCIWLAPTYDWLLGLLADDLPQQTAVKSLFYFCPRALEHSQKTQKTVKNCSVAQKAVSNLWRFLRGWGVFKGRKLIGCATWTEIQQFALVVEPIMTNVERLLRNSPIFTKFSTQKLRIYWRKNLIFCGEGI